MWNMKCFVIPEIIGTSDSLTKGLNLLLEIISRSIQNILYKKQLN